jgi:hypothetical protein
MRSAGALIVLAFITMLLLSFAAMAQTEIQRAMEMEQQDRNAAHAEHHDVYKTWCQPGREKPCLPYQSCCNERKEDGSGDCYPTDAEFIDGHWSARLWRSKEWIIIPDEKIIKEINPDTTGSRAHLCEVYGQVLCFVPPFGGG